MQKVRVLVVDDHASCGMALIACGANTGHRGGKDLYVLHQILLMIILAG